MFHIISRQHFGAKKEFHSTVPKLHTEIDNRQYFFPPSHILFLPVYPLFSFYFPRKTNDHLIMVLQSECVFRCIRVQNFSPIDVVFKLKATMIHHLSFINLSTL